MALGSAMEPQKMHGQNDNAHIVSFCLFGLSTQAQKEWRELTLNCSHVATVNIMKDLNIDPMSKLAEELRNPIFEIEKQSVCRCCEKPLYENQTFAADNTKAQVDWLNLEPYCRTCVETQLAEIMHPHPGPFPVDNKSFPFFICKCGKGKAELVMQCRREAIERPANTGDEYVSYDMGDTHGTVVCVKCKTKMTYTIEIPLGG